MKKFLIAFCVFLLTSTVYSVASNYETKEDSVECLKQYSIYYLNLKKKMYDYALESWKFMFNNCPDVKSNMYADGIKIYKHYYNKAKSQERKDEILDTMMLIYDRRIQYFGNNSKFSEGWILGRKGMDLFDLGKDNVETHKQVYDILTKSNQQQGDKSEPVILFNWLKVGSKLYKEGNLEGEIFLDNYLTATAILNKQLSSAKTDDGNKEIIEKIKNTCDELLVSSGAGNCSVLSRTMTQQYETDSTNVENVSKIVALLNKLSCDDSPLFIRAVEQSYRLNPTAESAGYLARFFLKKSSFDKAKIYYSKAVDLSEDDAMKGELSYELAGLEFSHFKNYKEARDLALKSASFKSSWGIPYVLIGKIYAAESSNYGKDAFDHSAIYWLALDYFSKAKSVDNECAEEANKQIALYSQYIPDQEACFFRGYTQGDSFKIESWINESTKVRFR